MTDAERIALEEMIMGMLMTNSANPNYGAVAAPMNKYGEPEPLDLDAQSKAYNVTQDWADIFSDPAILGGMMPETITPEMLQPTVTYDPLPGQRKLRAAMANPNSLEAFIAEGVMSDGASATIANIETILSDQSNPLYPELAGKLRTVVDPNSMQETYDFAQVEKIANDFQNSIWDDPTPTLDESGQPITDQAGLPSVVTSEETPQAKWFRETGTPLPWQEWSTDQFATPLQQIRRDESFAQTDAAEDEWNKFRDQRPTQPTLTGADRQAYINNMLESNMTTPDYPGFTNQSNQGGGPLRRTPEPAPSRGGYGTVTPEEMELFNRKFGIETPPDYPGFTNPTNQTFSRNQPPPAPPGDRSWATPGGGSREGDGPARGSRYEAELRLRDQERAAKVPSAQQTAAWKKVQGQRAQNHKQLADEAMRKRMIAQLVSNGITPYTSTMNSRRSQAQQSGFGF